MALCRKHIFQDCNAAYKTMRECSSPPKWHQLKETHKSNCMYYFISLLVIWGVGGLNVFLPIFSWHRKHFMVFYELMLLQSIFPPLPYLENTGSKSRCLQKCFFYELFLRYDCDHRHERINAFLCISGLGTNRTPRCSV